MLLVVVGQRPHGAEAGLVVRVAELVLVVLLLLLLLPLVLLLLLLWLELASLSI